MSDEAREAVARWMIEHSYATGHGDTLDDLLRELTGMPKGAVAVVSNLDMLTEEPLELAVALRRLAESKQSEREVDVRRDWAKFAERMGELIEDLKALNEPTAK